MPIRVRDTALFTLASLLLPSIILASETVEIFNGHNLTGWTKRGGAATYAVENGEVVGRSAPNTTNTFLCTDKDYGDFELEYDFKIDDVDFNSGVQIRSHARPEGKQERVYGYQIEIDPKPRAWSGGLYFEGGSKDKDGNWIRKGGWLNDLSQNEPARKAFRLGKWNHIRAVVKGRRFQTWINGVPAADYSDNDDKAFTPTGFIALQVHAVGNSTETKEIRWKNIKLKTL
jgi:3-keto-disaccharide hydrolase